MVTPKEVHDILGKRILVDGFDMVLDLERSKGAWIYDSRFDRKFLDFFGFFATNAVGMNHPKFFDTEFLRKLERAAINKPTNSDVYTVEMAEFVDTLSRLATPPYMKYFFFIDGGALAVENALKTAFDWKVKKNFRKGYREERGYKVIHLREAFHGRSGYTLSLTNTFDPRKTQYFPKFNWPRITNPKITFPLNEENRKKVEELEKKSIEEMERAIRENPDDIAAFIMEPIQGEGGDNHFRKEYFKEVEKITKKNDIMFIVDEVQSGMGITGKWWAHEHFDVQPDIIAFGKKSQVCGIMVGPRVDEIEDNVFRVSSRINSTWGGNLADMVKSKKVIEIIHEERLLDNASRMGDIFIKGLMELQEKMPGNIFNVRGRGLMDAFDLRDTTTRDRAFDEMYKNGLLMLKTGEKGIRFRPPLIVGLEEVNMALSLIEKSLKNIT